MTQLFVAGLTGQRKYLMYYCRLCSHGSMPVIDLTSRSLHNQPKWLEFVLHGGQDQKCSTGEVCWEYDVFCFGFYL